MLMQPEDQASEHNAELFIKHPDGPEVVTTESDEPGTSKTSRGQFAKVLCGARALMKAQLTNTLGPLRCPSSTEPRDLNCPSI
jgi:hypothetical protein